ncbi:DUF1759 domain-containing protein, partial [Streptococcus dysgalactiae subsp. equisimilis]|nr:DUF1759 domain-containing protein [Streptococcus dysgalactiae subsp. equisimilis]
MPVNGTAMNEVCHEYRDGAENYGNSPPSVPVPIRNNPKPQLEHDSTVAANVPVSHHPHLETAPTTSYFDTIAHDVLDACCVLEGPGSKYCDSSLQPHKEEQCWPKSRIEPVSKSGCIDNSHFLEQELSLEEEELRLRKKRLMLAKLRDTNREVAMEFKLTEEKPSLINSSCSSSQPLEDCLKRLAMGMTLPKIEIDPFSGSAEEFVTFSSTFSSQIESQLTDSYQKLCYLIYYCRGAAKDAIKHCVLLPRDTCFRTAMEILKSQYGRPHQIIQAVTENVFTGPMIRSNDLKSLQVLSRQMRNCSITLTQLDRSADLNCSTNLVKVIRRLPKSIQMKWAEIAETFVSIGKSPTFDDLLGLIEKRVAIGTTEYGMIALDSNYYNSTAESTNRVAKGSYRIASVKHSVESQACPLCGSAHQLDKCSAFINSDVSGRWQSLKDHKRCFRCLKGNHRIRGCNSAIKCQIDKCGKLHHPLLHSKTQTQKLEDTGHVCTSYSLHPSGIQLGFVPVRINGPNGCVTTYAFLDNGSDCTLIDRNVATQLGLTSKPTSLQISTLHGVKSVSCGTSKASFESVDGEYSSGLNELIIVDKLPVHRWDNPIQGLSRWPHLRDITIHRLASGRVGLLIGCDVPDAHKVMEQRVGTGKEPFAVKSVLGWVVRGPMGPKNHLVHHVNAISTQNLSVQDLLLKLYNSELGDVDDSEETEQSVEDLEAVKFVKSSAKLIEGHYELAVPWRDSGRILPDNRQMALSRLMHLRRKLKRDETLRTRYVNTIHEHLRKGHIREGTTNVRRWFLPHHSVINPKKPEKLRVVFDCAASHQGVSLNDKVLQGPDLTNKLTGVLLRFRRYRVAISADIREMFLQVKLPEKDRAAFSFLWWKDGNLDKDPMVYEWTVHPFGATSSPFCANYALRSTVKDNINEFQPALNETVLTEFYVDDYLSSTNTVAEALTRVSNLPKLLKRGGFDLVKWSSNSEEVISHIDSKDRLHPIEELHSSDSCQRALGVKWHTDRDVLKFDYIDPLTRLTRRALLRYVASIYDPLGFISPILLPGKLMLQDLCRRNIGWDVELGDGMLSEYLSWVNALQLVQSLEVERCLIRPEYPNKEFELHLFSDASERGYDVVAYLRQVLCNHTSNYRFLMGKSRVAPLKFLTIPRLELTAALLAAKLSVHLTKELNIILKRTVFWTDSTIVLQYLFSKSARYLNFVANRVRRIQELSDPSQWRYVPTESNPADIASREINVERSSRVEFWLNGPRFLVGLETSWPSKSNLPQVTDGEMEIRKVGATISMPNEFAWLQNFADYSANWITLLRRVVWLTRFKRYLQMKISSRIDTSLDVGDIKVQELPCAITYVVRMTQAERFGTKNHNHLDGSYTYLPPMLRRLKPLNING